MPKQDVVMVRARLREATPDPTQYKPYAPVLEFDEVYVDIPVPAELVDKEKGGRIVPEKTILTLDGMTIILDQVATAIQEMNRRRTQSQQTPGHRLQNFK